MASFKKILTLVKLFFYKIIKPKLNIIIYFTENYE